MAAGLLIPEMLKMAASHPRYPDVEASLSSPLLLLSVSVHLLSAGPDAALAAHYKCIIYIH